VYTYSQSNIEMTTDELQIATQLTDGVLKTTLVSLVKTKVTSEIVNTVKSYLPADPQHGSPPTRMTRFP
jgi:hypothetical protein